MRQVFQQIIFSTGLSVEKLCLIKLAVNLSDVISFSFRNEKDVLKNDKANHILLSVRICV